VPIVPVAVRGTYGIMPKDSWLIRPGDVAVVFGQPIVAAGFSLATKEVLMEAVRDAISRGLAAA
jgi:1-acyl-sn-glycerol-3-phosphate acyltransferase